MILIMAVNYSDFEFLKIFNSSHNNYDRLNTGLKFFLFISFLVGYIVNVTKFDAQWSIFLTADGW